MGYKNIIHLISDPEGNSFVFPRVLMFPSTSSTSFCFISRLSIAHLHDDVTRALHAGICSQTPGRFKNNGGKRGVQ